MKYFFYVVLAASIYFYIQSSLENRERRNLRTAEIERLMREQITAVEQYISVRRVNSTWMNSICSEGKLRISRVRTMELETAWLPSQLVMFHGNFGDISALDEKNYTVEVKQGLVSSNEYIEEIIPECMVIGTGLGLELTSDRRLVEPYLNVLKNNNSDFGITNTHVFIASISRVESRSDLKSETGTENELIGFGTLHEIFPVDAEFVSLIDILAEEAGVEQVY